MQAFDGLYEAVAGTQLIAPDGTVLISTIPDLVAEGIDLSSLSPTAALQVAGGLQGDYLGDLGLSVDGVTPIIAVATPIVNTRGQIVGMVSLRVNANRITDLLAQTAGLGETGETYLVNGTTNLMLSQSRHTTENTILQQTVDTEAVRQAMGGVPRGAEDYTDYSNTPVVGAWQRVAGRDWVVVGEMDQSEAYASANQLAGIVVLVIIIAGLAILLVSFLVARTISRPITRLTASALRIAAGDLSSVPRPRVRTKSGSWRGSSTP